MTPPAYEPTDASPRTILVLGAVLAAGVIASLLIAGGLYRASRDGLPWRERERQTSFRDAPAQQTSIARDRAADIAAEPKLLGSYGWVDRSAGIVRIPIDRAIELTARDAAPPSRPLSP